MGNKARRKANKARKAARKGSLIPMTLPVGRVAIDRGLESSRSNPDSGAWEGCTHLELRLHQRTGILKESAPALALALVEVLNEAGHGLSAMPHGGTHRCLIGAGNYGSAFVWIHKGRTVLRTWYPEASASTCEELVRVLQSFGLEPRY